MGQDGNVDLPFSCKVDCARNGGIEDDDTVVQYDYWNSWLRRPALPKITCAAAPLEFTCIGWRGGCGSFLFPELHDCHLTFIEYD